MDFSKFLSLKYLFDARPATEFSFTYQFAVAFLALIVLAVLLQLTLRFVKFDTLVKRYLKKAPLPLYLFGGIGLLLVFFRYENAPYLAMRLWLIILLLWFIYWVITFILQAREIPRSRQAKIEAERMKRYQP